MENQLQVFSITTFNRHLLIAAICIAYVARKLAISLKDAFGLIKDVKKDVRPNNGFVKQLKEYHDLLQTRTFVISTEPEIEEEEEEIDNEDEFDSEDEIPTKKMEKIEIKESKQEIKVEEVKPKEPEAQKAEKTVEESKPAEEVKEREEKTVEERISEEDKDKKEEFQHFYCRKCRNFLFDTSNIIPHKSGVGQQAFSYHKRGGET
jgi:hypothetical protein